MDDTKEKIRGEKIRGEKITRHKAEKFFFDMNCFDEDYEEEIIEAEPPPPTFSEKELEAARKDGHARGRQEALADAEASREKHIAGLLATISNDFQKLFSAEAERAARYEAEAVALSHAIFKKLFPALNKRHGLAEIEDVIRRVLQSQHGHHEITIDVNPDYSDSIRERLEPIAAELGSARRVSVAAKENLGPGDCLMRWNGGGADRNMTFLTAEIHRQLEHMLAGKATLHDNETRPLENARPQEEDISARSDTENGDNQ